MNKQFVIDNARRFHENSRRFCGGGIKPWIDEGWSFIRYGSSPDDYFRYEFYRKSGFERDRFITYRRSQKIIREYNNPQFTGIFSDKREFNRRFSDYTHRDWLDLSNCSADDLQLFFEKHHSILIKPAYGGQGKGIFKLDNLNGFCLEDYRDCIAEEILMQHPQMSQLNPSSVNTVRVLTFKGEVVACALRIGGDNAIVDNLHSSGICAHLDIDSGMIDASCIDNRLYQYLFHPKTGKQLVGFRVPNWDRLIRTVKEAAKEIPEVAYVGWDVAVLETETALIEGNHDPGHDVVQMIAQTGLWKEIQKRM